MVSQKVRNIIVEWLELKQRDVFIETSTFGGIIYHNTFLILMTWKLCLLDIIGNMKTFSLLHFGDQNQKSKAPV